MHDTITTQVQVKQPTVMRDAQLAGTWDAKTAGTYRIRLVIPPYEMTWITSTIRTRQIVATIA